MAPFTKRILIIQPEGNLLFNQGLVSICSFLIDETFDIEFLAPTFCGDVSDGFRIGLGRIIVDKVLFRYLLRKHKFFLRLAPLLRFLIYILRFNRWNLVIGVDRDGIILANCLSKIFDAPSAFISYEIFFEAETSKSFKVPEIIACNDIHFAVCQDHDRAHYLSIENHIPLYKIINIPVSPRGSLQTHLNRKLRGRYQIKQPYIAVVAGSVDRWSLVRELVQCTDQWPDDWALLVHSRYGIVFDQLNYYERDNVYFTDVPFASSSEAANFFSQADLGIALYQPTYDDEFTGMNLEHLGMSSGKTAMYLSAGLPVLTTESGHYPSLLLEYNAGIVVRDVDDIAAELSLHTSHIIDMRHNAAKLFREVVDADLYREEFLRCIGKCMSC